MVSTLFGSSSVPSFYICMLLTRATKSQCSLFQHLSSGDEEGGGNSFEKLHALVERLAAPNANEKSMTDALKELAELFASPRTSV
jgi:hypothetical protein